MRTERLHGGVIVKLFLSLLLGLTIFSGQLFAQDNLPATYQVIDLNLNVRTGPGTRYTDIGNVPPLTQVVVTAFNDRKTWAEIEWEGATGWVSTKYINYVADATPPATTILPPQNILTGELLLDASEISCVGTEPFWNLGVMDQTQLTYSKPDSEAVVSIIETIDVSANNVTSQMFASFGFTGIIHAQQCSDGMSDTQYNWAIDLVVNDGFGAKLYSGCCSVVRN